MRPAALAHLARVVKGPVLSASSPGYDDARAVFNLAASRRPAAIARCQGPDDVRAVVALARAEGLPLSVRAGGHSIGGFGVAEGALVVDLRLLKAIELDRGAGTATVGGGCTWGDVLDRLSPEGCAISGGFDPRVGVSGLTLGGGYGLLARVHGLSCDDLVGAEVVTAVGDSGGESALRRTSTDELPELLWALRGAGANFGATTGLRFAVHAVPPVVTVQVVYPLGRVGEVLRRYRATTAALPDATTVYLGMLTTARGLNCVQLIGFHLGPRGEALRLLAPLLDGAHLGILLEKVQEAEYRALHAVGGEALPDHHHHAWQGQLLERLSDRAIDAISENALRARDQDLWIVIEQLGGAVGRIAADATAFPHRGAGFGVVSTVKWRAPEERPGVLAIQARLDASLAEEAVGRYVNYVGDAEAATSAEVCYGGNLPRLRALKGRFDPGNLFRSNVNITPVGTP